MPTTRCPHCGKVQGVDRKLVGSTVGCMNHRCEFSFIAREYARHSGALSQFFFACTIGFAVFLIAVWGYRHWYLIDAWIKTTF
jgi:hypothetical protein